MNADKTAEYVEFCRRHCLALPQLQTALTPQVHLQEEDKIISNCNTYVNKQPVTVNGEQFEDVDNFCFL